MGQAGGLESLNRYQQLGRIGKQYIVKGRAALTELDQFGRVNR